MLAFAIGYARDGFPATPGIVSAIARMDPHLGRVGRDLARCATAGCATRCSRTSTRGSRNPADASREARIDAARDAWYRGWVAERLVAGFLSADDLAAYRAVGRGAGVAAPFRDWTVFKTGPVGSGSRSCCSSSACCPTSLGPFLGDRPRAHGDRGREARVRGPRRLVRRLRARAAGPAAVTRVRGRAAGADRRHRVRRAAAGRAVDPRYPSVRAGAVGDAEPTRGDTCHLDVADRFGNLVERDPERRLAAVLPRDRRRSASRSAPARRCSGSRKASRRR